MSFPLNSFTTIIIATLFIGALNQDSNTTYPNPAFSQLQIYAETHANPPVAVFSSGIPVDDLTNSLSAGAQGPLLMQDSTFFQQMQSFVRERIPPRIIFAKGAGAFGYLEIIKDISNFTSAKMFGTVGQKIPVTVRFSRMIADPGRPDTIRDVGGFAVKFHTEEGIWDLVGANAPISWVRDPLRFPSLLHSMRPNPTTNLPDPNAFWDFLTLNPETVFISLAYFSDYGIPRSYRQMHAYSVHAFQLVNAAGANFYAKFQFYTNQGVDNLPLDEAASLAGALPDFYTADLYNSIALGNLPTWNMTVQIITPDRAKAFQFNPFDPTKDWNVVTDPQVHVGTLVLTSNPTNYFTHVESVAFNPGNLVPGIQPSPDKLFQGRMFAYNDAQTYRLGVNGHLLKANMPSSVVNNYQRDGFDRYDGNQGGAVNYYPNSFNGPVISPSPRNQIQPFTVQGRIGRYNTSNEMNFFETFAGYEFVLTENQRMRLVANIASSLSQAYPNLQVRGLRMYSQADQALGEALKAALLNAGLPPQYLNHSRS